MSDSGRKWGKMRRSKSASVIPPTSHLHQHRDELDAPLRHSPRANAPAFHRPNPPESPTSASVDTGPPTPGSTPPKKHWERSFGAFLTTTNSADNGKASKSLSSPALFRKSRSQLNESDDKDNHGKVASKGGSGFRLVPGSKKLLMKASAAFGSHDNLLAPDSSEAGGGRMQRIPPSVPMLSKRSKSSGSDTAVRGGNVFGSVFASSASPRSSRKAKSMDALDSTLRKGHGKSFTPENTRFTKQFAEDHVASASSFLPSLPRVDPTVHGANARAVATEPVLDPLTRYKAEQGRPLMSNLPKALAMLDGTPSTHDCQPPRTPPPPAASTASSIQSKASAGSSQSSSAIKKAFTEFHNSATFAQDSTSAYLGDEPSAHNAQQFVMYNTSAAAAHPSKISTQRSERFGPPLSGTSPSTILLSSSFPLESVQESNKYRSPDSARLLKPVVGPDSWKSGRRYLIAPASLSHCRLEVLRMLWREGSSGEDDDGRRSVFSSIPLGKATVTSTGRGPNNVYSVAYFILKQNYLFEYEVLGSGGDDESHTSSAHNYFGVPRGIAHLEGARAYPHSDFKTTLELQFFGSPCSKSDLYTLLIRVDSVEVRDFWLTSLNRAASLTIDDLYAYQPEVSFGKGRYASVHPAKRVDGSDSDCAIKIIDKNEFWRRVVKGMERADTLVRESSVQATLTAKFLSSAAGGSSRTPPSFLQIRSFFETSNNVVMELEQLKSNDLFQHIVSHGILEEKEAALIMKDLLTCLEFMSRHGLAHRDIKPANVLMCDYAEHGCHVKVADFGMATFVGVDGLVRGRCGTPGYAAPEIFTAGPLAGYSNKVDVFSAGVCLYVMLCGYEPFYGETDSELIAANRAAVVEYEPEDWSNISAEAKDLLETMLQKDPARRISARETLTHPWIVDHTRSHGKEIRSRQGIEEQPAWYGIACTIS